MNDPAAARYFSRRGLMLILSSPSGAGKTTISRALLEREPNLILSISVTTRPKRPSETDGADYHFVDKQRFDAMVDKGELLEHAHVFGHDYGTPRGIVEAALSSGTDVLFDIDWQGTQQLGENSRTRADLVSVFVLPPSGPELEARLRSRAQDPEEVVRQRMAKAADEMSHYREYKYVLVNDNVEASVAKVRSILAAERLLRERQVGLHEFVESLRGRD